MSFWFFKKDKDGQRHLVLGDVMWQLALFAILALLVVLLHMCLIGRVTG